MIGRGAVQVRLGRCALLSIMDGQLKVYGSANVIVQCGKQLSSSAIWVTAQPRVTNSAV